MVNEFPVFPACDCSHAVLQSQYEMSPQLCLSGPGNSLRMTPFKLVPATPTLTCTRDSNSNFCLDSLMPPPRPPVRPVLFLSVL